MQKSEWKGKVLKCKKFKKWDVISSKSHFLLFVVMLLTHDIIKKVPAQVIEQEELIQYETMVDSM
jgi:hypothetical protein